MALARLTPGGAPGRLAATSVTPMAGVSSDQVITRVADLATHDIGAPGGRWARRNNNDGWGGLRIGAIVLAPTGRRRCQRAPGAVPGALGYGVAGGATTA